jgi:hydrophobe/amphiphile efflux-3 (HAE3) family protein
MDKDLALLFPLSLLLSAIILLFFYRKLVTTIVPLVPVLIAIVWVLGLKGWTGVPMTPISITLFPLIMVIGLANSIHIINHYKRERQFESNNSEAITKTLQAIIKPCFLAAFTTAIGFGSLAISDVTGIKQMGIFAAFGVMSAFLLSIIIIPLSLKYSNVFAESKPNIQSRNSITRLLLGIDRLNHLHSWKVMLVFLAITVAIVINIPKIKVEGSMASFAKENTRLRQDIKFLDSNMSGINAYELIIKGSENSFKNPENLTKLDEIARELSENSEVLKTFSAADMVKTINKALHANNTDYYSIPCTETEIAQYLFLYEISGGDELSSFVNEDYSVARVTIRTSQMPNKMQKEFVSSLESLMLSNFGGMDCEITGFGMLMNHINENLISTQVESILMAFGIILILMFIMFGFKGGLLSILPNVFPILFFMGLMGIFGIDLNMATSIIAAVTIGIVVDDTIHFFFGYKNEMQNVNNPAIAVTNTMLKVGTALCVTSLILTLGFGILVFSNSKFIGDFGIMSASAIASALLGDIFISPIVLIKSKLFKK